MLQVTQKDLRPGVHLTAVQTRKFKTSVLGVTLMVPLDKRNASANALLPYVLRRGTYNRPDMQTLSAALDEMYGGTVSPIVRKKGEALCIGLTGSFLDDALAPEDAGIRDAAARLLTELLLHPALENGGFRTDYVAGEKKNLMNRIRAQINDKRLYATARLTAEMCADEAYGTDRLGDEASAAAITPESLWNRYQDLLSTAAVELYYCGSASPEQVEQTFAELISGIPEGERRMVSVGQVLSHAPAGTPRMVTEPLDVAQCKLSMGFRTGGITAGDRAYPALQLFNAVYGGTTTSKLFMNVREKLSLCYYSSSMLEKFKGLMLVSSGVEYKNQERAKQEILSQLEACQRGEIDRAELESGRRAVVSSLRTLSDSQARLEDYWLGQTVAGLTEKPEKLAERVEQVTLQEVVTAAQKVELDTVYLLKGQEE